MRRVKRLPKMELTVLLLALLAAGPVFAAGFSTIGNGDDGGDLEALVPLTSGPIVVARAKALALLDKLNTAGIPELGLLLPEVRGSELFMADGDKPASLPSDQGSFHGDMAGRVYARTFATPHAATRFYPAARSLSERQLVALHIHEGLHRSLPSSVRENEAIVTSVTLAITSPGATHDQVRQATAGLVPAEIKSVSPEAPARYQRPSLVGYALRQFWKGTEASLYDVRRMHVLQTELYPFGGAGAPFGIGIEGSLLETDRGMDVGPLALSARFRLMAKRNFEIGIWGTAALTTLSNDKLKSSAFGRDVYTVGTSLKKALSVFYIENFVSLSFGGSASAASARRYEYSGVIGVKLRGGARVGKFDLGAFTELHLGDHFRTGGGPGATDSGRYRILSIGPELTYATEDYALSVFGRALLGATEQANYDYLGNLMGPGVSRGSIGTSVSVFF